MIWLATLFNRWWPALMVVGAIALGLTMAYFHGKRIAEVRIENQTLREDNRVRRDRDEIDRGVRRDVDPAVELREQWRAP